MLRALACLCLAGLRLWFCTVDLVDAREEEKKAEVKLTPSKIPKAWAKLLRQIPGYDPIATAEKGDWFDPEVAQNALDFFPAYLTLTKDAANSRAGEPFELEPWEAAIVANLFGWFRVDDYKNTVRRYRECLIGIPRKSGKTELCAGLGCLGFFWDREQGSEVYCAAKDRGQASKLFSAAKLMVLRSPKLKKACQVYAKAMYMPEDGSTFQPVSADAKRQHGENPHVAIVDELHVQPDGELVEALETGQAARRQPLLIYLSTSDHDRAGSICNEIWDHAREVRDGRRKASRFLPVLYEADDKADDWRDEKVWRRVNPNLGVSVSIDYLRDKAEKAAQLPRLVNSFKRLHLNIRTGQADQWLPMDKWDECDGREVEGVGALTREAFEGYLAGRACWIGMDLSYSQDMTAITAVFPELRDGKRFYYVLPYMWLPEDVIRDPKRDRKKRDVYQQWRDEGWLEATPGKTIDYERIRTRINWIGERFNVQQVGADPWNAEKTLQDLEHDGFECVKFRQTFPYMSTPSKEFEAAVVARTLVHGGHPVLREQARVVAVLEDAYGNIRPDKKRSGDQIDGLVATVIGIGLAMTGQEKETSVYEERGLRTIDA